MFFYAFIVLKVAIINIIFFGNSQNKIFEFHAELLRITVHGWSTYTLIDDNDFMTMARDFQSEES